MSEAHRIAWPEYAKELTEPTRAHDRPEALDDLRVLDLSSGNFAALFTSSILAEFGAEVIRVEPPGGDVARLYSPEGVMHRGTGLAYLVEARNKRHITLNLHAEEGPVLHARLIYLAVSTYGQFGPRAAAAVPDYDITDQALSGVPYVTGEPEGQGPAESAAPTKQGSWIAWYVGGGVGA